MIKISFIVAIGLLASALLRRRSAALRHWILAWTLVSAAAMPLLQEVAPAWTPPVGAAWLERERGTSTFGDGGTSGIDASAQLARPGAVRNASSASWLPSIVTLWAIGTFISLSVLGAGLVRIAWIASRAREVRSGPWFDAVTALCRRTATRPAPRLLQTDYENLLVTWGLRKPTIVLPTLARRWPAERLQSVLGHEVAHIRRRDWAVQMFGELVKCAYWFNPFVWIACHQLHQTSEQACDDEVLRTGVGATEYATHLLDVARALRLTARRSVFPAMAMARPSQLERRVRAMLHAGTNRSSFTRVAGGSIVLSLLILAFSVAGIATGPSDAPSAGPATISTAPSAGADTELRAVPGARPSVPLKGGQEVRLAPATPDQAAQEATASFSGSVIDSTGRGIADHPIKFVSAASGKPYETRTDGTGRFSITNLPAGEYQVEIQKPGFKRILAGVKLKPGQAGSGEFVLQLGMLKETIHVSVDPAMAAVADAEVAAPPAPRRAAADGAPRFDPCEGSVVGGCVTPPLKLVDVKPRYPRSASGEFVSGTVEVESRLGTDGVLKEFRLIGDPDPSLAKAALDAIRQWQFSQTKLNGVPQECAVSVTVQFTVDRK